MKNGETDEKVGYRRASLLKKRKKMERQTDIVSCRVDYRGARLPKIIRIMLT